VAVAGVSIGRFRRRLEPLLSGLGLGVREVHRGLLRAVMVGLLRFPSSYVSELARGLGEEFGPSLSAREHRLLRFLASPKLSLERLKATHRRLLASALPPEGRVFLFADLSDLAKPHARTMAGLDWVRDGSNPGSEKRIVRGYWLNEVYVELGPGRVAPAVFEIYSLRSGHTLSQTHVLLRGMDEAFEVVGPRGVWVADRGFDDGNMFDALLCRNRDFIIRLQVGSNARNLLLANGSRATVTTLLRMLPLPEMLYSDRDLRRMGRLGWTRVRLPDHGERVLTLVVVHMRGHTDPMAVLTTLPVPDAGAARRVVAAYLRRWGGAEDPVRFIKQTFRLERFLVASLRAMRVWVFLIGVAMALLVLLLDPRSVGRRLARSVECFSNQVLFLGYRLARALADLLQGLSPARYRRLLLASGP